MEDEARPVLLLVIDLPYAGDQTRGISKCGSMASKYATSPVSPDPRPFAGTDLEDEAFMVGHPRVVVPAVLGREAKRVVLAGALGEAELVERAVRLWYLQYTHTHTHTHTHTARAHSVHGVGAIHPTGQCPLGQWYSV